MDKIRSIYLESLRILAAVYVFINHLVFEEYKGTFYFSSDTLHKTLGLKIESAHMFVIVFFVLSGFLITMSVKKQGVTFKSFLIARLGRLYSVLIPALIFSYLVYFILIHFNFMSADLVHNNSNLVSRFILNLLFLNQAWTLNANPSLNSPFWSVDYEFIYYIAIAVFVLVNNRNLKILFLILTFVIAGPKILLLFPAWLTGSLLYFLKDKLFLSKKLNFVLFIISSVCLFVAIYNPSLIPFNKSIGDDNFFGYNLLSSFNYKADFILSIIVAANIYFLFSISDKIISKLPEQILKKLSYYVMKIGSCSYTLYLFHMPLLFFFAYILPYNKANYLHQIVMVILVLTSVFFIARQTEWKVDFWRKKIEVLFNWFTIKTNKQKQI